jgi:hypothetical protein
MRFAIAVLPHTFPLHVKETSTAARWMESDQHERLLHQLETQFDGFAVVARFDNGVEHPEVWADYPLATWSRLHAPSSVDEPARRVTSALVLKTSRTALFEPDLHVQSDEFLPRGTKEVSPEMLRWVLAHLGALPGEDTVVDAFTGETFAEFTAMLAFEGHFYEHQVRVTATN